VSLYNEAYYGGRNGAVLDTEYSIVGYFVCSNRKCIYFGKPMDYSSKGGVFPVPPCPSCRQSMTFVTNNPKK
jgi:hypothetical protein